MRLWLSYISIPLACFVFGCSFTNVPDPGSFEGGAQMMGSSNETPDDPGRVTDFSDASVLEPPTVVDSGIGEAGEMVPRSDGDVDTLADADTGLEPTVDGGIELDAEMDGGPLNDAGVALDAEPLIDAGADVDVGVAPMPDAGAQDLGGRPVNCEELGRCVQGSWCEPVDEPRCQAIPGGPVCYPADDPLSLQYCEGRPVDCAELGRCVEGGWCEPEDEPGCQAVPGAPVCYDDEHPLSIEFCEASPVNCAELGECRGGAYCEPRDERRCQATPGAPVCYPAEHRISREFCGGR